MTSETRAVSPTEESELFFGLIGAVGTNLHQVGQRLESALKGANYTTCVHIRLSHLLHIVDEWENLPSDVDELRNEIRGLRDLKTPPEDERIDRYMDLGNMVRKVCNRGDAVALLAIGDIRIERGKISAPDSPANRTAYVLNSLKHPNEVRTLRQTYGKRFFAIGAYSRRRVRKLALARRIANTTGEPKADFTKGRAKDLMVRDELERGERLGQNVAATFAMADVFIDATDPVYDDEIERFIELIFKNPFHTPRQDEYAMFQAKGAALRSAALSRQVGATIGTPGGSIIALGMNEVPKPMGGLYSADDEDRDYRDIKKDEDASEDMRRKILAETIHRMNERGWLSEEIRDDKAVDLTVTATVSDPDIQESIMELSREAAKGNKKAWQDIEDLLGGSPIDIQTKDRLRNLLKEFEAGKTRAYLYLRNLLQNALSPFMKDSLVMQINEYGRTVHAEMAALMDAAHRGVAVSGCHLYTTTFPCHECARHIVAAGITRVVYVEPYPKSYAEDYHDDAIVVNGRDGDGRVTFQAFVGVSPRGYMDFFDLDDALKRRVGEDGKVLSWSLTEASLHFDEPSSAYLQRESKQARKLMNIFIRNGLMREEN